MLFYLYSLLFVLLINWLLIHIIGWDFASKEKSMFGDLFGLKFILWFFGLMFSHIRYSWILTSWNHLETYQFLSFYYKTLLCLVVNAYFMLVAPDYIFLFQKYSCSLVRFHVSSRVLGLSIVGSPSPTRLRVIELAVVFCGWFYKLFPVVILKVLTFFFFLKYFPLH